MLGYAVHEIAAVHHFFAECRESPGSKKREQGLLQVSTERLKNFEVGVLAEDSHEKWLAYEKLKCLQHKSSGDSVGKSERPGSITSEANAAPRDFAKPREIHPKAKRKGVLLKGIRCFASAMKMRTTTASPRKISHLL